MMAVLRVLAVATNQPATAVAQDAFLAEQAAAQATNAMRCPAQRAALLDAARRLTVAEQRYRRLGPTAVVVAPPAVVTRAANYDCASAATDLAVFRLSVESLTADLDRMEHQ